MALDPRELARLQSASVQTFPSQDGVPGHFLISLASMSDSFSPWGVQPALRDEQLRRFWPTEAWIASTVSSLAARNGAFSWTLEGPVRTCNQIQDRLHASNFGRGWIHLIQQISLDLMTQDNGAFVEIIREGDSPTAPFIGLGHLDASRVTRTGNLEYPYVYTDREQAQHKLAWWQAFDITDFPSPLETHNGLQLCAVSRLLRYAQIFRDVAVYQHEKVSGRQPGALHIVSGVSTQHITDALARTASDADGKGLTRFVLPAVLGTLDPSAEVKLATILLKSMPDGWDPENDRKWWIALLALAFGCEYQDLAPLPGGGLGTSQQSQILHLKAKGRGPELFMKLLEHRLNFYVLPKNVQFKFDEKDYQGEEVEGRVRKLRAETRQIRIASGEITPQVAQQIAQDEGDLKPEYLLMLQTADATPDETITDEQRGQEADQAQEAPRARQPGQAQEAGAQPGSSSPPAGAPGAGSGAPAPGGQKGKAKPDLEALRDGWEAQLKEELDVLLPKVRRQVAAYIRREGEAESEGANG